MLCFASFLWFKNEKELLKKLILAEAYKEVQATDLNDLGVETSLIMAIQKQLRGVDYPSDNNVKLNANEITKYTHFTFYYKIMYMDAYVAQEQCYALGALADPTNVKKEEKDNIVESIIAGPLNDKSELLILKCYLNWIQNDKSFKLPSQFLTNELKYKFRDIQKDSLRCYLIYIPIQIIRYISQVASLKKEDFNKDEVFVYIITKVKLLKFGS